MSRISRLPFQRPIFHQTRIPRTALIYRSNSASLSREHGNLSISGYPTSTGIFTRRMATQQSHAFPLPADIPAPTDDGAANHLQGSAFPSVSLPSTSGSSIDPSTLSGLTIVFCYPRTAAPGETVPDEWNSIPGARGCTPQNCAFRDMSREMLELGVSHLFGCSTQSTAYQQELKERLHLPYQLLSDENLELIEKAKLPTFNYEGKTLHKRLALAIEDGTIMKVWYPVFPPDRNAGDVLEWLRTRTGRENLSTEVENEMFRNMQKKRPS